MQELLVYLTWDPDGTQSHTVCLFHLTGVCWDASATLPTQLEYSKNKTTEKRGLELPSASICSWIIKTEEHK